MPRSRQSHKLKELVANPKADRVATKRCSDCKDIKPASQFSRYSYTTKQGKRSVILHSRCKRCCANYQNARRRNGGDVFQAKQRQWNREWQAANRKHISIYAQTYRATHPRKSTAWKRESWFRRNTRLDAIASEPQTNLYHQVLELSRVGHKYLDAYTGDLIDKPTVDHVVPLSGGGAHVLDNLCVTSFSNNASKNDTPLLVWLLKRRADAERLCRNM